MNLVFTVYAMWAGALVFGLGLLCFTIALAYGLAYAARWAGRHLLQITRFTTARYWVGRMEREGLTVCMHEYRRMVAERNARTVDDFVAVEKEWEGRDQ